MDTDIVSDFEFLIDTAQLDELRLKPSVGNDKYSPDLMTKRPGRPPVGVQGMILDAMDDELVSRKDASQLLGRLQARISGGGLGMSIVTSAGDITPIGKDGQDGR